MRATLPPSGDHEGGRVRLERWTSPVGPPALAHDGSTHRRLAPMRPPSRLALPHLEAGPRSFGAPRRTRSTWRPARLEWRRAVASRELGRGPGRRERRGRVLPVDPATAAIRMAARRAGGEPEPLLAAARALPGRRRSGHPDRPGAVRVGGRGGPAHRRRAGAIEPASPPVRWVDDVVFAGDRDAVRRRARGVDARPARARAAGERGEAPDLRPANARADRRHRRPSLAGHIRRGIIRTS